MHTIESSEERPYFLIPNEMLIDINIFFMQVQSDSINALIFILAFISKISIHLYNKLQEICILSKKCSIQSKRQREQFSVWNTMVQKSLETNGIFRPRPKLLIAHCLGVANRLVQLNLTGASYNLGYWMLWTAFPILAHEPHFHILGHSELKLTVNWQFWCVWISSSLFIH